MDKDELKALLREHLRIETTEETINVGGGQYTSAVTAVQVYFDDEIITES